MEGVLPPGDFQRFWRSVALTHSHSIKAALCVPAVYNVSSK